jgi:hypothetical protein
LNKAIRHKAIRQFFIIAFDKWRWQYGDLKKGEYVFFYLYGTQKWEPRLGGRPTVLWDPQVQIGEGGLGVRDNVFGFTISSYTNLVVVVEACTNLGSAAWVPVSTNILSGGTSSFSDPQWTNYPARFYRFNMP